MHWSGTKDRNRVNVGTWVVKHRPLRPLLRHWRFLETSLGPSDADTLLFVIRLHKDTWAYVWVLSVHLSRIYWNFRYPWKWTFKDGCISCMLLEFPLMQLGDMSYCLKTLSGIQGVRHLPLPPPTAWSMVRSTNRSWCCSTMNVFCHHRHMNMTHPLNLPILVASQIHPGHSLVGNVHDVEVATATVQPGQCGSFD